jgi:NitT/TauT family transport system permease protein
MTQPVIPSHLEGTLVIRPEYEIQLESQTAKDAVARNFPIMSLIAQSSAIRKATILLLIVVAWQLYTTVSHVNELVFPSFFETMGALIQSISTGEILSRVWLSLTTLLESYVIGLACAAVLTIFAVRNAFGRDLLSTLTSMFNPLPAIALVPLAMLWFGLSPLSLIFVVAHSVLWAVALNVQTGFLSVSEIYRMVGRNYGIKGIPFVYKVLMPAALPSILAGLKIGWAFAWRTLIAAELVFGANQGSGGLGWYIFENSQNLKTANVFAGLLVVMLIGVAVENGIFQVIEKRTVRRWGLQQ